MPGDLPDDMVGPRHDIRLGNFIIQPSFLEKDLVDWKVSLP
jgi:hypothetical protein